MPAKRPSTSKAWAKKTSSRCSNAGLVKDPGRYLHLKTEDVAEAGAFRRSFGQQTGQRHPDQENSRRSTDLCTGLGIRHIGTQTAMDLANHFRTLENAGGSHHRELAEVEGIGEVVAESVVEWFSEPRNQATVREVQRTRRVARAGQSKSAAS